MVAVTAAVNGGAVRELVRRRGGGSTEQFEPRWSCSTFDGGGSSRWLMAVASRRSCGGFEQRRRSFGSSV
ncbi:superoxide dismutase [Sesbania bispinosa]|nr:superoxide dismutase [Sesbania bispinosa]